jgi:hypothetical protein
MMTKKIITIFLIIQGFIFISEATFGQSQNIRIKIDDDGMRHIENKGYLCIHYIDSISSHYQRYLNTGYSEIMTQAQRHLGFFKLLLDDPSVYEDGFFLASFDSLYPVMLSACEEFGFYQFVNVLNELNEHRNQKIELFQNDATTIIFNDTSDLFDQELFDIRRKLYKLREEYGTYNSYVETLREYILTLRDELIK